MNVAVDVGSVAVATGLCREIRRQTTSTIDALENNGVINCMRMRMCRALSSEQSPGELDADCMQQHWQSASADGNHGAGAPARCPDGSVRGDRTVRRTDDRADN